METASWVFGSLFAVFLMAVVGYRLGPAHSRPIDPTTQNILGFVCAVLAGLFAFFFTGTVAAQVNGSSGGYGGVAAQATGGMALFVIVLWWWRSGGAPLQVDDKTIRALETNLGIVDRIYPEVKAVVRGEAVPSASPYSAQATRQGNQIIVSGPGGNTSVITSEDLKRLSDSDQRFIEAMERSMKVLAKQWTELFPKRNSGDAAHREKTEAELQRLASEICADLQRIFKHLRSIGAVLEDHYSAMRSICNEAQQATRNSKATTVFNTNIQGDVGKQTNINKVDGDVSF